MPSPLSTELGVSRYLGLSLVLAGLGLAVWAVRSFASAVVALYALVLWVVYHLLTVYREEPELRATLGETYEQYCEDVPRWL